MVIYWEMGFQMFFQHHPKCSWGHSYILLIPFHPITFESVDDATLLSYRIFVFRCHQEVFDGFPHFEVHLYTMFPADSFYVFTQAFCIWDHYVVSFVDGVGTVACWYSCCFLLDGLEHYFYSLPCSRPMLDIYIWSGLSGDVLVLPVTVVWWTIQL